MSKNPVVILGGGISGLSCAYYLTKIGKPFLQDRKIIVIEGAKHMGGWLRTHRFDDGVIHELGPRSLRVAGKLGKNSLAMVDDIGLPADVIGVKVTDPAAQKRLIWANGKLNLLPMGLMSAFRQREPFSKSMVKYAMKEWQVPKLDLAENEDISVYDFLFKRFGKEMAEYFADPLCRGITAGDSKRLSMRALFPEIFHFERTEGSVVKGFFRKTEYEPNRHVSVEASHLHDMAVQEKWVQWSFKDGLQTLPRGLCNYLLALPGRPVSIFNESKVKSLKFPGKSNSKTGPIVITATTPSGGDVEVEADYVFSALPAHDLAKVLSKEESSISHKLNKMESVDVAVVCLEYEGKDVVTPDAGFGFLVPSSQNSKLLGVTYDSCVYEEHDAQHDVTRLTCMMGGQWFEQLFGPADKVKNETLLDVAVKETARHLGFKKGPIRSIVNVHKQCIPQYRLNHRRLVEEIKEDVASRELNLQIMGNSFTGVAVNECIFYARKTIQELSHKCVQKEELPKTEEAVAA